MTTKKRVYPPVYTITLLRATATRKAALERAVLDSGIDIVLSSTKDGLRCVQVKNPIEAGVLRVILSDQLA